jgi:hypothetical protein
MPSKNSKPVNFFVIGLAATGASILILVYSISLISFIPRAHKCRQRSILSAFLEPVRVRVMKNVQHEKEERHDSTA